MSTAFSFILVMSLYSMTSFASKESPSDALSLCKTAFEEGMRQDQDFSEPLNEDDVLYEPFSLTSEELDKAWWWYYENKSYEFVGSLVNYGSIFLIPTCFHFAYSSLRDPSYSFQDSFKKVSRTLHEINIIGGILYRQMESFLQTSQVIATVVNHYVFPSKKDSFTTWVPEMQVKAAELHYWKIKDSLPQKHQKLIDNIFTNLFDTNMDSGSAQKERIQAGLRKIKYILALPKKMMKVKVDEARLSELIQNFNPELQNKLRNYAESISYLSHFDSSLKAIPFRDILYIQGPPGTGKSYFLDRFAEIFYEEQDQTRNYGLPVIRISLEGISSLEDLIGDSDPSSNNEHLSKLAHAFSTLPKDKNYKNAFIIFDEADKTFNKKSSSELTNYFIKTLFASDSSKVQIYGFDGLPIDISNANFLLAANAPVYDAYNAFMDRMTLVQVGPFEIDKRISIACHKFGQGIAKLEGIEISDREMRSIVEAAHKDQENNPGLRSLLKTIGEFVSHLSHPKRRFESFPMLSKLEKNTQIYKDIYSLYEMQLQKYQRRKNDFTSSQQKHIEMRFHKIVNSKLFYEALLPENKAEKKQVENYLNNIDLLMSFPSKVKNLSSQKEQIERYLKNLLKPYSQEAQTTLTDAVRKHIQASTDETGKHYIKKHILYIYGPPGTGKSYLAQGLAKVMGLNVLNLDFKGSHYVEFFGGNPFDFTSSHEASPLVQLFTQKQDGESLEKNSVLYVNEIDKILNYPGEDVKHVQSYLLDILDSDLREMEVKDLHIKMDVSRFFYILVGNENLDTQRLGSSLADRMTKIRIDGYDVEGKIQILWDRFEPLMKSHGLKANETHRKMIQDAAAYSHIIKQQTSLRPLLDFLESYLMWIRDPIGDFDFQQSLDLQDIEQSYERNEINWKEASKYFDIIDLE